MSKADGKRCAECGQVVPPAHGIMIDGRAVLYKDKTALLTHGEMRVFSTLLEALGRTVTYEILYDRLYPITHNDPPQRQIINVFISKIRPRIKHMGLDILCEHAVGYRLERPGTKPRETNVLRQVASL